jgi:ribonuclease HI
MKILKVYTDGASRGNPGCAGAGIVIYDPNDFILLTYKEYLGEATNNQAEYRALIKSLDLLKKLKQNGTDFTQVQFYSDSELLVNQINYDYAVKDPDLALLNNKFHVKARKLRLDYSIIHIAREKNKNADKLANLAIDSKIN